jgi:hypothetical protein
MKFRENLSEIYRSGTIENVAKDYHKSHFFAHISGESMNDWRAKYTEI